MATVATNPAAAQILRWIVISIAFTPKYSPQTVGVLRVEPNKRLNTGFFLDSHLGMKHTSCLPNSISRRLPASRTKSAGRFELECQIARVAGLPDRHFSTTKFCAFRR